MAGRPREFDRDLALAKARDAFWERGYEGVSMSDLVAVMGIASARIYAAFGSKENLFREAIALYEADEGGFAERALGQQAPVRAAIDAVLRDAVLAYTRPGAAWGCMVVSAATNYSSENDAINAWLAGHRRARTDSIVERLRQAAHDGELKAGTDVAALGDYYAALLHGISVQARDGTSSARLLAMIGPAMRALDDALAP